MKIGIDFDNTIVTYDKVFHHHAVRLGLIPADMVMSKREIRDAIRQLPDGESRWIELQGLVYGLHIDEAEFSPGIERFLSACKNRSVRIFIISHKTPYPALGPRYDLREAARKWIEGKGMTSRFGFSMDDCFFADTMAEKLTRIAACCCDYFIDDLLEVFSHPEFPGGVRKVLYSSGPDRDDPESIDKFNNWDDIHEFVFGE